jgi:hypothetical protein
MQTKPASVQKSTPQPLKVAPCLSVLDRAHSMPYSGTSSENPVIKMPEWWGHRGHYPARVFLVEGIMLRKTS